MNKLYRDVEVIERTEISREGKVSKVYRTSAVTISGVHFTIEITESDFSEAKVNELLTKKATLIEAVKAL